MNTWAHLKAIFASDHDALTGYHALIAEHVSRLTAWLLVPLTVWHMLQGRWAVVACTSLAVTALTVNVNALRRGTRPPLPLPAMIGVLIAAIGSTIALYGTPALLWAYPTLFITYFVLPRRDAHWLAVALIAIATVTSAWSLSPMVALRVAATLGLNFVMINLVLGAVTQLQQALVKETITDALTGTFNRRHFDTQLATVTSTEDTTRGLALLTIDVDHFKAINDRHGHAEGDRVLRDIAALLRSGVRETDRLFRTGGEEFVLLLDGTTLEDARAVAEQLRHRVEAATLLPDRSVTVSIGVGLRRRAQSSEDWLRDSDAALYRAKAEGRNRVVVPAWEGADPLPADAAGQACLFPAPAASTAMTAPVSAGSTPPSRQAAEDPLSCTEPG